MGLDMYLNRMPRFRAYTAKKVSDIENYFSWLERGERHANCSLEEWCGLKRVPTQAAIDFYRPYWVKRYSDWDTEKKYGHNEIMEQVGYWRKANHIHKWFVDNIQDGEDDCRYHREVRKTDLEELLRVCNEVIASTKLVSGKVYNGTRWNSQTGETIEYIDGLILEDTVAAEELLPTECGFFFGSTGYDEWYMRDIEHTIEVIENVLETTDFNTQMIYYVSSW